MWDVDLGDSPHDEELTSCAYDQIYLVSFIPTTIGSISSKPKPLP